MKKLLIALLFLSSCSDKSQDTFDRGEAAYRDGWYEDARDYFSKVDSLSDLRSEASKYLLRIDSIIAIRNSAFSIRMDSIKSLTVHQSDEVPFSIQNYLVAEMKDSTLFQLIRTSCAIKIELTQAEIDGKIQREAEFGAKKAISYSIWDATEHDSASINQRMEEEQTMGDDDMWYRYEDEQAQEKLLTLDSMKVTTFTASEKSYLKMVGRRGKVWMVDIRTKTEAGRSIVFFNVDKEPIILDRLDLDKVLIRNYFLSPESTITNR